MQKYIFLKFSYKRVFKLINLKKMKENMLLIISNNINNLRIKIIEWQVKSIITLIGQNHNYKVLRIGSKTIRSSSENNTVNYHREKRKRGDETIFDFLLLQEMEVFPFSE